MRSSPMVESTQVSGSCYPDAIAVRYRGVGGGAAG
jgi:hypothetical protein